MILGKRIAVISVFTMLFIGAASFADVRVSPRPLNDKQSRTIANADTNLSPSDLDASQKEGKCTVVAKNVNLRTNEVLVQLDCGPAVNGIDAWFSKTNFTAGLSLQLGDKPFFRYITKSDFGKPPRVSIETMELKQ